MHSSEDIKRNDRVRPGMTLSIGNVLRGQEGSYRLLEILKVPAVSKAQHVTRSSIKPAYVVVKSSEPGVQRTCLHREFATYNFPAIASCQYIRRLRDIVGSWEYNPVTGRATSPDDSPCLVFEWMEHDLRGVPYNVFRGKPEVIKEIARSVLSALAWLKNKYNSVHTDISPNNVFISGTTVKIGDLGNVLLEGSNKIRVQSLACRAPEVWRGLGCWHASDVWSLGVTMAHCLCPASIFGARDKILEDLTDAWCIAKIGRLVGHVPSDPIKSEYEEDFVLADHLETGTFRHPGTGIEQPYITVGTLREELTKVPGPELPQDLIEFIEHLLVVDYTKRPTALEALQHPYLQNRPGTY